MVCDEVSLHEINFRDVTETPGIILFLPLFITSARTGQREVTGTTRSQAGQTSLNSWDKYKLAHIHNHFLLMQAEWSCLLKTISLVPVLCLLCPPGLRYLFPSTSLCSFLPLSSKHALVSPIWREKTPNPWLHLSFRLLPSSLAFNLSFLKAGYPLAGSSTWFPV